MNEPDEKKVDHDIWRHGYCYPATVALWEKFGGVIQALVVDIPETRDEYQAIHLVHAFITDELGLSRDTGGTFDHENSPELLHEEYLSHTGRKWSNSRIETFDTAEEFLLRLEFACGEGFWDYYKRKSFDPLLVEARAYVEEYVVPTVTVNPPWMKF